MRPRRYNPSCKTKSICFANILIAGRGKDRLIVVVRFKQPTISFGKTGIHELTFLTETSKSNTVAVKDFRFIRLIIDTNYRRYHAEIFQFPDYIFVSLPDQ